MGAAVGPIEGGRHQSGFAPRTRRKSKTPANILIVCKWTASVGTKTDIRYEFKYYEIQTRLEGENDMFSVYISSFFHSRSYLT